jgi:hypothetical protein
MRLPVDPDEHFVQVPAPVRIRPMMNATLPGLWGKQRTETIPLQPHGLMAYVDTALEQQIFDLSQ